MLVLVDGTAALAVVVVSSGFVLVVLTGALSCGGCVRILWELPDVMSASEGGGGHGQADVVREVA